MNKHTLTTVLLSIIIVFMAGATYVLVGKDKHGGFGGMNMAMASSTDGFPVSIQTVTDQKGELGSLENTWPGDIVSFGDILIQPRRDGTIVEWNVNIGQRVRKGQLIARLSAPPAMPEFVAMLAEQAKMVTEARVDAKAQADFAKKKKEQLTTLLTAIEKAQTENTNVLDDRTASNSIATAARTIEQAKNSVLADRNKISASLEQSLNKELRMITYIPFDVITYNKLSYRPRIFIKDDLGKQNTNTREEYLRRLNAVLNELSKESGAIETAGAAYFEAATKMMASTGPSDDISEEWIAEFRDMIAMDQAEYLETVKDYQMSQAELAKMETEYRLMLAEKKADYAMQRKEIEEQISMLDKDITMSNGKVEAAENAYGAVATGVNGGLAITAPADGVITAVMKKNGDFVEPGMAIASLNTGRKEDRFVRFRIPSNVRQPEPGSILVMARPGFPKDIKKVKLIGVGTALDTDGSFMADAKYAEPIDWPVNVSVRVMPNGSSSSSLFVTLAAIEWNESGASIWKVKADNTITKVKIKTHRTLGEKVEVYEGLSLGDRYVTKLATELAEGLLVREGETTKMASINDDPHGGGGGGHEN